MIFLHLLIGVPLFLMVTGMLTLNKEIDLSLFFKKKFVRIVYPLIFYLIIAEILHLYSYPFLSFWFCWMIIGVYLAIPVVNKFILNSSLNDIRYFVILFLFTSTLYTFAFHFKFGFNLDLNFFIGPVSYLILGYYLSKKEFGLNDNVIIVISLCMFILVSVYKIYFGHQLYFENNSFLLSRLDLSIFQVIQAISVFLIFKYVYRSTSGIFSKIRNILEKDRINNCLVSVSRSTYGMYLLHWVIFKVYLSPLFKDIPMTGTQGVIVFIVVTVSLFIFSWISTVILGHIPFIKNFSGYA